MGVVKGDRSIIRKNSTGSEFINRRVNLIEGSNVTLTVASDPTNNEVDVTIASTGGGSPTFDMGSGANNKVAYWVNASTISFASGLAWDSSNTRLGVGVSTPVALLDLAGTDGSSNGIAAGVKVTNLETGGGSWFVRTGATGTNTPAGGLSFSNNSNYWAMFDSAGKLGLGAFVNGPNEQLTLNGRFALGFTTGASQSSGYGKAYVKPDGNLYYLNPTGTEYALSPLTPGVATVGGTGTANKLSVFVNASMVSGPTALHWDFANGRLGIGTATPAEILHVRTPDYATMRMDAAADEGFFYTDGVFHFVVAGSRTDTPFRIVQNATQRMDFSSTENVFNDNGLSIDTRIEGDTNANLFVADASADKVGIGTATPEEMLHVRAGSGYRTIALLESPASLPDEATLTTRLSLGSDNYEFVDWTIEDYDGVDHKASINIGKSGSGASLIPFTIRTWRSDLGGVAEQGWEHFTINPETEIVINEQSRDLDFRVESDASSHLLFADAGLDRVGIGTSSPPEKLSIGAVGSRIALGFSTGASQSSGYGKVYVKPTDGLPYYLTPAGVEYDLTATGSGTGTVGGSGLANKLTFWANASMVSTATLLSYDAANFRLGINTPAPENNLDLVGDFKFRNAVTAPDKAMRFRFGGALDQEIGGTDWYVSTWENADFTGAQYQQVQYDSGGGPILFKRAEIHNNDQVDYDMQWKGENDDNAMFLDASTDSVGFGLNNPSQRVTVAGRIGLAYTSAASATNTAGYGKVYAKTSDGLLYYMTAAGVEYDLTAQGAGGSGAVGGSGVANKMAFWTNASMLSGASLVNYEPSTGVLTATKLVRGFASTPTSTATWSVDFNTGSLQYTMLSAATVTVWLQNAATGGEYTLIARQDATGGRFLNWPTNVVWAGGTTPTPTSSATYVDMFKLIYNSTASVYWAVPTLNFAR